MSEQLTCVADPVPQPNGEYLAMLERKFSKQSLMFRDISLRDHFAGQALAAAAIPIYAENQDEVAAACYSMADAMLRARGDAK